MRVDLSDGNTGELADNICLHNSSFRSPRVQVRLGRRLDGTIRLQRVELTGLEG